MGDRQLNVPSSPLFHTLSATDGCQRGGRPLSQVSVRCEQSCMSESIVTRTLAFGVNSACPSPLSQVSVRCEQCMPLDQTETHHCSKGGIASAASFSSRGPRTPPAAAKFICDGRSSAGRFMLACPPSLPVAPVAVGGCPSVKLTCPPPLPPSTPEGFSFNPSDGECSFACCAAAAWWGGGRLASGVTELVSVGRNRLMATVLLASC